MREGKFTILILVVLALLGAVWTAYSSATTISELPPLVDPPIGIFIV